MARNMDTRQSLRFRAAAAASLKPAAGRPAVHLLASFLKEARARENDLTIKTGPNSRQKYRVLSPVGREMEGRG
jgi:hypothetical protein